MFFMLILRTSTVILRVTCWCFISLVTLLTTSRCYAQAPDWKSAVAFTQLSSAGTSGASATAVNTNGDVYVVGSFSGSITLGSIALTSSGRSDAFIAKWSRVANTVVWALRAGGTGTTTVGA
jgi:hypothetical protein